MLILQVLKKCAGIIGAMKVADSGFKSFKFKNCKNLGNVTCTGADWADAVATVTNGNQSKFEKMIFDENTVTNSGIITTKSTDDYRMLYYQKNKS